MITLCPEQEDAKNRLLEQGGVLMGRAGSGKSTVMNAAAKEADVTMCATTARAALNVDGCTFDRLFAYSRDAHQCWNDGFRDYQMRKCGDVIGIDEASMMDDYMVAYAHHVCHKYDKTMIMIGDWAQAAPVNGNWAFDTAFMQNAPKIRLRQNHRQSQREFLDALEEIRYGGTDPDKIAPLLARVRDRAPDDPSWMRLFGTNRDADNFNTNSEYKVKSDHPEIRLWASYEHFGKTKKDERSVERLLQDSRMTHGAFFKIGCRVMVTKNIYDGEQLTFANGDTGDLVDVAFCTPGNPTPVLLSSLTTDTRLGMDLIVDAVVIKLDRTGERTTLWRQVDELKDPDGSVYGEIHGVPLDLGYAFTTHKMQGVTLDRVCIDAQSLMAMRGNSKHGLFYVGASRARTIEGLVITNWTPDAVYCDPVVKAFELGSH